MKKPEIDQLPNACHFPKDDKLTDTAAMCNALSFLAMMCVDFKPENFEIASKMLAKHKEVMRDLCNDEVAEHYVNLCHMRMGETLIQNDFK